MVAGDHTFEKVDVYADFGNSVLLRAVRAELPEGGAVLDVGCASGGLLAGLRDRAGRREGIELDPAAAAAAQAHADVVHVGNAGDVLVDVAAFDVVVLGDVLEHLADPRPTLARAQRWLRPEGRLVVSVPNVAHWSIRSALLFGRWEYRDSGILDDTHLRFFTWPSGARLVQDAGFAIERREPIISALGSHLGVRIPQRVERRWRSMGQHWPNLFAFQQLIVARRA